MKNINISIFSFKKLFAVLVAGSVIVSCGNSNQTGNANQDSLKKAPVTMTHADSIKAMIDSFDYAKHDITKEEWAEASDSDKITIVKSLSIADNSEAVDTAELAELKEYEKINAEQVKIIAEQDKLNAEAEKLIAEQDKLEAGLKKMLANPYSAEAKLLEIEMDKLKSDVEKRRKELDMRRKELDKRKL